MKRVFYMKLDKSSHMRAKIASINIISSRFRSIAVFIDSFWNTLYWLQPNSPPPSNILYHPPPQLPLILLSHRPHVRQNDCKMLQWVPQLVFKQWMTIDKVNYAKIDRKYKTLLFRRKKSFSVRVWNNKTRQIIKRKTLHCPCAMKHMPYQYPWVNSSSDNTFF